jgi:hypothetical protein
MLGPEGSSESYWSPKRVVLWNTCNIWNGPNFTGEFDGLAQVRQARDSVLGVVSGCKTDDQEVHTQATTIRAVRRQLFICYWFVLMRLSDCTNTILGFPATLIRRNPNSFSVSEILLIAYYWNSQTTQITTPVKLIGEIIFLKSRNVYKFMI